MLNSQKQRSDGKSTVVSVISYKGYHEKHWEDKMIIFYCNLTVN